jgi:hypothetical protein
MSNPENPFDEPERRHSMATVATIEDAWPKYWAPDKAFEISRSAAALSKCYERAIPERERVYRLAFAAYLTLQAQQVRWYEAYDGERQR